MKNTVLYMIVGLPGSGKTTKAKEIEAEESAVRFTPDEWIVNLYGADLDLVKRDAVREPVESVQWQTAKRLLEVGCSVVLDWGFWSKQERDHYKNEALSLGVDVKIVFINESLEELWKRISARPESQKGTLHITREMLEQWSKVFETPGNEELS